jgi:glycine dehydrogenase
MAHIPTDLPYNPQALPRELNRFYIGASDEEQKQMLASLNLTKLDELFNSLPSDVLFKGPLGLPEPVEYGDLVTLMREKAAKNILRPSFIGDALPDYAVQDIVPYVCGIRGLTTAYTPYQPERSQGTLTSLWIYSSALSMLTGFEAINASLYERSTCLYEAINTALRLKRNTNTIILASTLFPGDLEVIETLRTETNLSVIMAPINRETGLIDLEALDKIYQQVERKDQIAGLAFPQVTNLGLLEEVDALTDWAHANGLLSIAVIDPMLLGAEGLKAPSLFGSDKKGVSMIVGEGQHLTLAPNFGGPGLGIFGIRYNENDTLSIRQTAGRYVGLGVDQDGERALTMVLSTREQHIRREKATSNICSNQSFVATIAGAALLQRGDEGMARANREARSRAVQVARLATSYEGVELAYERPFFNEVTLSVSKKAKDLIEKARVVGLHLGVDVSERDPQGRQLLKLSLSDRQSDKHLTKLSEFLTAEFGPRQESIMMETPAYELPSHLLRADAPGLPSIALDQLKKYYDKLGNLNLSPDDAIYPLGSCTMKYNPYINDYAAGLAGFAELHPQAPEADVQGALELLYEIQEWFKKITGLPGLTTQPVAGAQGELVGLKLFQAYHRDKGEADQRKLLLIPRSAHGTNPATATMAGFETKKLGDVEYGIIAINADHEGRMDLEQIRALVDKHGTRIAGVMVTNPNTSGLFETNFKQMAELIHSVDGLVYMDGANMNAIAGWVDLGALGVDAVHNNLHKTWTIPHGGGGPGDAIVAVSEKLIPFLPGTQVEKKGEHYHLTRAPKSIGSFHRHHGNFAHKVRCYTYLRALGEQGIRDMAAVAVLSAAYLYKNLKDLYPTLPEGSDRVPRMHEFILTLDKDLFDRINSAGTPKAQAIAKIGKLFLDFGMHAPTVAFPEVYGMMIEPTESFTKAELDHFTEIVKSIHHLISEHPEVLRTAPHFTPVKKVDEVLANKNLVLFENLKGLPPIKDNPVDPRELNKLPTAEICAKILAAHRAIEAV